MVTGLSKSFKAKLILSYVFIVLISFGFIAYFLNKNLEDISIKEIKSSLTTQARLIDSQITLNDIIEKDYAYLGGLVRNLSQRAQCRVTVIDNNGIVLADSEKTQEEVLKMENHSDRPEILAAFSGAIGDRIRYSNTLRIDMLYVALPVINPDGSIEAVIRLALPLTSVKKILSVVRRAVIMSLFFALGLVFVVGSVLAGQIIKPIHKIINISRRFSRGDFNHKIFVSSGDELEELAGALNKMAQGLEDKIREIEIKNQHLVAILESMVEGIIVVDKATRIISVNTTIEKIFRAQRQNLDGRVFIEAIRNNDIAVIIEEVLEKGEFKSCELSISWPVQRIFQIDASPVFEKEEVSGCLLVIHDMTDIKKLETMRKDLVANVSHELKTPLTSIKGFIETLLEGALEDKEHSRHFLQIIQNHANQLDSLVNDLLDLSYLESKEIALERKEINIRDFVSDILSGFRSQLKKTSVSVDNDLPSGLVISIDVDKIGQVLTNLIGNAIKFNRENGTAKIYSQDLGSKIKIFIEDSGIGIPPKDIPRIFERFYCVDKGRSRELGGTGLGLSIVKHIVQLHGGEVGVESIEGLGSKFWFTLPK
jgi:two-component system phosphate regulon sensor histidine kinase PhoR